MELRLDLNHTGVLLFDLHNGEADEAHTHDHFQMSVPISNELSAFHNYKKQTLAENQSLLVPPGDRHQHEAKGDHNRIMLISFNQHILSKVYEHHTGDALSVVDFHPIQDTPPPLLKAAYGMFQSASMEGVDSAFSLEEKLAFLLLEHTKGSHSSLWEANQRTSVPSNNEVAARLKEYIQSHYDEELSLDRLALKMNISKYHLHRLFKASERMTPLEYLHLIRIQKAGALIKNHSYDMSTAAYEVGYQSLSTFNRVFKKIHNVSPTQFKRMNR
ncbi:AraC family transcriptional regulator [Halobacillus yeomjeoni]|uniref:Helix-turn-helix transcriptional regulator n=1 Tax=Halobacillus yeomjeoni TaxID=311194 RepID=A0A931MUC2_9BACI|nr:AraC family transcriptional regulator [Halobacillus yeomjeoni]MBH0229395.1 helix-turn-helix transcriptional regulator [Halobacillus yeomjeoni]MCA0983200.1 AraC family transcriptional regulator [Halobacillus yeomjeoni]